MHTVAIYWDSGKKNVWYMIIDDNGNFRQQGEPKSFLIGKNSAKWNENAENGFKEMFDKIMKIRDKVIIKYKVVNKIAQVTTRKGYRDIGKDSDTVDRVLQKYLTKNNFTEGDSCFYKKTKLSGKKLTLFKNILTDYKKETGTGPHRLWAIALHETNFEELCKSTLKIFNGVTRLNDKNLSVEKKQQIQGYLRQMAQVQSDS